MTGRKTMAILGEVGTFCPALAEKLAQQPLRLLFVSADEDRNTELSDRLKHLEASAEIEFINCEKDGCWEADIITFTDLGQVETELVQKIREVATQKLVLVVSEENEENQNAPRLSKFQELLPHSRVFRVAIHSDRMEAEITGNNDDAGEVQEVFRKAGYKIK